ncbi:hypothetical protein TNIN_10461 [Trichonephila inaurata madagascariensis]|uniref:Uncharacterized protein n=1 Tax=Trichonephila inaurata madagascariensis TaxID=2747483 RepID=A0A8X7BNA6_9ARAC|nr:hypothetical protein TNIN_10461 [Trichonephila inaurata madagascariensis]
MDFYQQIRLDKPSRASSHKISKEKKNVFPLETTEDLGVKRIESAKTISDKWSQGVSYAQGEQEAKASRRSSLTWIPIEKATSPTLFFSAA